MTAVEPEWLAELGPMFFSIKVITVALEMQNSFHCGSTILLMARVAGGSHVKD